MSTETARFTERELVYSRDEGMAGEDVFGVSVSPVIEAGLADGDVWSFVPC